ncbi:MAG: PilN domain-containing protein [Planctomycetes bacterium]|nr:PilN domain-containing protein [Planctomycetota bacterium]
MTDRRNNDDRRLKKQRRRTRNRGKVSNQSYTVIEIAGADLRAVTLIGADDGSADQVRVMTLRWRNEASTLNSDTGLDELTAALSELSEKNDLQTTNLQFVLGGEFCVTKAVRGTTEEVRSELQQIEQRSRLYLMLGPGEKVTVSKLRDLDARHQYAVAAVCNKRTLDTIHEAATRAGMHIDAIEPALVATSRAIGRLAEVPKEPCLLIHLDDSAVELGVCHDGSLLLDYRPGGRTDPEELIELVRTHLNRLQRHVGRQLRIPPPQLKRIYLCGKQAAVDRAYPVFSACEQFDVERIDPANIQATWEFAEPVTNSEAIPALGALLSKYLPDNERDVPNFMEHILASTREPLQPVLFRSIMPLAAVLLVALTIFALNFSKQQTIDEVQQQLDSLAIVQARDRELRLQRRAAELKLTQLTKLAAGVPSVPIGEIVAHLGHCMPTDVWLNRLEIAGMESIQITGASYLEAGVFDFVNWLDQSPGFEDVALRSTRPGQSAAGPAIDFTVELNLGDWNTHVKEVAHNESRNE